MGYSTSYELKWETFGDYKPTARCDHELTRSANYCAQCGVPAVPVELDRTGRSLYQEQREYDLCPK